LWPAKIGPFTIVVGRHYHNSDTSDLPFSYLIESDDESVLVPGINLRSVGTIRDARKWPERDKRSDPHLLDFINFNLLSPYTIQKMINGLELLTHIKDISGETSEYFTYNSVKIKNNALNRGIELYKLGITKFLGNCLIKRLENRDFATTGELQERLRPETQFGKGAWVDLAGLLAPQEVIENLLDSIDHDATVTLDHLQASFKKIHADYYYYYDWTWAMHIIEKQRGKPVEEITAEEIIDLTQEWIKSVVALDNMLIEDARKEFSLSSQISFGIDGDIGVRQKDFEEVRGTFDTNTLVIEIRRHIASKTELGNELLGRLRAIKN
jgi:hypothetical protein